MLNSIKKDFIPFLANSKSSYHVTDTLKKQALKLGCQELSLSEKWHLESGKAYFLAPFSAAFFLFQINQVNLVESGFRIIGTHLDSPGFRIKPDPEIKVNQLYTKLNTEVYGGPILTTWFDRPLSVAGRVYTGSQNSFRPQEHLIDLKNLLLIPSLAIHLSGSSDKDSLNPQKDMLPLLSAINQDINKSNLLLEKIAHKLGLNYESILDMDLFLYDAAPPELVGLERELIAAPRLDNLVSVFTGFQAFSKIVNKNNSCLLACFDNEETGSNTKQGADSGILANVLERIVIAAGFDREDYFRALANSFMVSADGAHALHPNKEEKSDPVIKTLLNQGPVIKVNANQRYTSDSFSIGVLKSIAAKNQLKLQYYVNRSDIKGGSTIGPMLSALLNIPSIDIGVPLLAMHSIRETAGVHDLLALEQLLTAFYNE